MLSIVMEWSTIGQMVKSPGELYMGKSTKDIAGSAQENQARPAQGSKEQTGMNVNPDKSLGYTMIGKGIPPGRPQ